MTAAKKPRVLLIGWDAADWKVMGPLLDAGEMPNLERLLKNGVMGNLATLTPILSPMLWTSIATGKRAWKHGIHGFAEPDHQSGGVRPITQLGRKVKTIWNILNQEGYQSNVVGWWPSHPVEAINGVMVSDFYHKTKGPGDKPWPLAPGSIHPQRLVEPLKPLRVHPWEIEAEQIQMFVPRAGEVDQAKDKRLGQIAKNLAECASVHAAATAVMQNEPWDFMAIYFDTIDHFCHGFMKYHPPRLEWIDEADYALYNDVVNSAYRFHDLMLGVQMQLAGADTHIMIVSDHGFHPDHLRPRELPNEPAGPAAEHRPYGMFVLSGPGIRKDELIFGATLLDVTPTLLSLFGLPVARDMDGRALLNVYQETPQPRYIDSWESVDGDDGRLPADSQIDAVDTQESLQQLVDLGYIDKPDEKAEVAVANTVRELRYNLARDLIAAKRYHQAIEELDTLWEEWPEETRFGLQIFNARLAVEQFDAARDTLKLLAERKKQAAQDAGEELQQLQKTWEKEDKKPEELSEQEQRDVQRLRKRSATNLPTLAFMRASLLHAEKRHGEALFALQGAAGAEMHNRPSVLNKKGEILLAMRRWEEAEQVYQEMLEIDPINARARLGMARSLLGRRRNKLALEEATAAVGLLYGDPQAHFYCGVALHRIGRLNDAIQSLQTAIGMNPYYTDAHRRLAQIYDRRMQDPEKAAYHTAMVRESRKQLRLRKAGQGLPGPNDQDLSGTAVASLGAKPPLDSDLPMTTDTVVVVSGLPRSGTSMLMQMLAAGGLPVMTDRQREADEDNPRGYFELEAAKALGGDQKWLDEATGKAVKLVAQLLPTLPAERNYRVLFMERPLAEVVASQSAMLQRLKKKGGRISSSRLSATYLKQIDAVKKIITARSDQFEALSVPYHEALENPRAAAERVNRFLGGKLDVEAMAAAIDPSLRRQRA